MTDIRQIQHFEAVFRLRSFSQAADEVNLTHAAITKSIKALEARWGASLFQRTTRSVTPTAAGQRLYKMVPEFLAHAERVRLSVNEGEGPLHIVCGPVVLDTLVHPALLKLHDSHPHVRVSAESKPPLLALEDIAQRRADLMLMHSGALQALPKQRQIAITPLIDEPYYVVCQSGHGVLASARTMDEVVQFDWAIAGFDRYFVQAMPKQMSSLLAQYHFPKFRLFSQAACLDMVRQSNVLTAVPKSVAIRLFKSDDYDGFIFPGDFRFEVSAASLVESRQDHALAAMMAALLNE